MGSVGGKRVEYNLQFPAEPPLVLVCSSSSSSRPVSVPTLSSAAIPVPLTYTLLIYSHLIYSTLFVSFDTVSWEEAEDDEGFVTSVYIRHMAILCLMMVLSSTLTCWGSNFAERTDEGKCTSGQSGLCFTVIYGQTLSHAIIHMCTKCMFTYPHKLHTWPTGGLLEPLSSSYSKDDVEMGRANGWQGIQKRHVTGAPKSSSWWYGAARMTETAILCFCLSLLSAPGEAGCGLVLHFLCFLPNSACDKTNVTDPGVQTSGFGEVSFC